MTRSQSTLLRQAVLVVILLNVAFNYIYDKLPGAVSIAEVSRSYHDLFTPAGYVFAIWGIIYLSFIIYGIVQLRRANREVAYFDSLGVPLLLVNVLGSAWIVVFTQGCMALSVVIIVATLLLGLRQFLLANASVNGGASRWLLVPFSLFFGWISVAVIANITVLLVSVGWSGFGLAASTWVTALIAVAAVLGGVIGANFKNFIYPAVISWALTGIGYARRADFPEVAKIACIWAGILALMVVALLVRSFKHTPTSRS
ncbi:hypothetical protein [Hufsiella ginkgonis]|uniref:Tryptophan-rich sensory protein n=1 Tax=Hufsiella ginkgonis TaxID=2695274 RepID=A0A7K1XU86_9SPHI|nr:hypothetical protein [Hufsiella ginkgonis]MXV14575.1 hypothetical protein [Hufsiella ginkgonis]